MASPAQAGQTALATGTVPASFFGMVVKNPGLEPAVPTGARRLWDCGVSWATLEPARGSWQWGTLDAEVEAAAQAGAEVTLTLGMTPAWASSQPGLASAYGAGATAMPAELADWDSYVTAVASRYRGRIAAYEVWAAPENPAYWSGATAQMGENMAVLSAHAAAAIHGVDEAALVVSPTLSPTGLTAFLLAGGGTSVDVVGTALGSTGAAGASTPESMTATLGAVRETLAGTGAEGKPVWNEQASWLLPQGGLPAAAQAVYVARALLLNAGYGVARLQWYAWDERSAGALALTDASVQPTAAAAAYSEVESWLAGAQVNGCAATAGGVWTCQLVRSGKTEWVVWTTGAPGTSSSLGASTVTTLSGATAPVAGGLVAVSASPVLLE